MQLKLFHALPRTLKGLQLTFARGQGARYFLISILNALRVTNVQKQRRHKLCWEFACFFEAFWCVTPSKGVTLELDQPFHQTSAKPRVAASDQDVLLSHVFYPWPSSHEINDVVDDDK